MHNPEHRNHTGNSKIRSLIFLTLMATGLGAEGCASLPIGQNGNRQCFSDESTSSEYTRYCPDPETGETVKMTDKIWNTYRKRFFAKMGSNSATARNDFWNKNGNFVNIQDVHSSIRSLPFITASNLMRSFVVPEVSKKIDENGNRHTITTSKSSLSWNYQKQKELENILGPKAIQSIKSDEGLFEATVITISDATRQKLLEMAKDVLGRAEDPLNGRKTDKVPEIADFKINKVLADMGGKTGITDKGIKYIALPYQIEINGKISDFNLPFGSTTARNLTLDGGNRGVEVEITWENGAIGNYIFDLNNNKLYILVDGKRVNTILLKPKN